MGNDLKIAVVTLTRDRLAYTKLCGEALRENAGCPFDWIVLDQGSQDGTPEWLRAQPDIEAILLGENIGISRALNLILDRIDLDAYDVVVKVDNDTLAVTPDVVHDLAWLAVAHDMILSPMQTGVGAIPARVGVIDISHPEVPEPVTVELTHLVGGRFKFVPMALHREHGFRYNPNNPPWGGDDSEICMWQVNRGGRVGYVQCYEADHYEASWGQPATYPEYELRKCREMGIAP